MRRRTASERHPRCGRVGPLGTPGIGTCAAGSALDWGQGSWVQSRRPDRRSSGGSLRAAPAPVSAAEVRARRHRRRARAVTVGVGRGAASSSALHAPRPPGGQGRRASVVLPPEQADLVGLEAARRLGRQRSLRPNTASRGVGAAWSGFVPATVTAGPAPTACHGDRVDLPALAGFDPDSEVDEDGRNLVTRGLPPLSAHWKPACPAAPSWAGLVAAMRDAGPSPSCSTSATTCSRSGPAARRTAGHASDAYVIALTATPPETLRSDHRAGSLALW